MVSIQQTLSGDRLAVNRGCCRDGSVELWGLDLESGRVDRQLLSSLEWERASSYQDERLRQRFIRLKGLQRRILGRYLHCEPSAVTYAYGPQGKPELPGTHLFFNLTHSGDRAILAIASQPVGVDLESLSRPIRDPLALAVRFFPAGEVARLRQVSPDHQRQQFIQSWVVKEAYLKGLGVGLAGQLESLDYRHTDHGPRLAREGRELVWSLRAGAPWVGWWAAIATLNPPTSIRWQQWTEDEENPQNS